MKEEEKSLPAKKIITRSEAERMTEKILLDTRRKVLIPCGYFVSKLPRKGKKEFKKELLKFILENVVENKFTVTK